MHGRLRNVAVCVPVRNEEHALPSLLAALGEQKDRDGATVDCCFFMDSCDDGSRAVIQTLKGS